MIRWSVLLLSHSSIQSSFDPLLDQEPLYPTTRIPLEHPASYIRGGKEEHQQSTRQRIEPEERGEIVLTKQVGRDEHTLKATWIMRRLRHLRKKVIADERRQSFTTENDRVFFLILVRHAEPCSHEVRGWISTVHAVYEHMRVERSGEAGGRTGRGGGGGRGGSRSGGCAWEMDRSIRWC